MSDADTPVLDKCYTGRRGTVRLGTEARSPHHYLPFPRRGHNGRYHRAFGHPCRPTGLRPLALAVPSPARRRVLGRLCLACAANHGPRGRARRPAGERVPPAGARRLRERRLPAVPHALLAGCERWDAPRAGLGRGGARPAARGGDRPGSGPPAPLAVLPVARRCRPDVSLVPVGRAAARDWAPGGAIRAHSAAAESGARARAFHSDAVARVGAGFPAHVPLRVNEARERGPHMAAPHRARLPLLDSTAAHVAGVVCAVVPRV